MPAAPHTIRVMRRTSAAALGLIVVVGSAVLSGCATRDKRLVSIEPNGPVSVATSDPATSPTPKSTPGPNTAPPHSVPARTATPKPTKTSPAPPPACVQGPKHRQVEEALAAIGTYGHIVVDGKQSTADCETIKKFQRRMGISPAKGEAGATTANVAARIAATKTSACDAGTATMACVDLTHQTFYIMQAGKVALGPTVTRTGMSGFATTAGTFSINDRALKHWSRPYKVWLPYWQHFNSDMGLHETTTYIHNMAIGSHGCVNLLHPDAAQAYSLLQYGSKVRVYGRRPGT